MNEIQTLIEAGLNSPDKAFFRLAISVAKIQHRCQMILVSDRLPELGKPDGDGNRFSPTLLFYNAEQDDFTLGYVARIDDARELSWYDKWGNYIETPTHWQKLRRPE